MDERPAARRRAVLQRIMPSAVRPATRADSRRDDVARDRNSVDRHARRGALQLNNAFIADGDPEEIRGLDGRFDLQVNQSLPFMNFMGSQWEMLVGVRNLFHEIVADTSAYDELLVVRPPKRIVGGLTVRF